ncbi:MAG: hypothetical protein IKA99_01200, partial [Clostridia bacterium]|nr:hypothetical protein [Clostridia bacterium]
VSVGQAFVPYLENTELFPVYNEIYTKMVEKGIEINDLSAEVYFNREYFMGILSPFYKDYGFYEDINSTETPTDEQINDISAVLYISYSGRRFLFMGDASKNVEKRIVDDYSVGLYDAYYNSNIINLNSIDVLKVAHHGSADSTTANFLSIVNPSYAVVSVGAGNIYNHPSSQTLHRLVEANSNVQIYRTDRNGDIRFEVNKSGDISLEITSVYKD